MMTSGMTAGLHAGRDLEDHSKRVLAEKVLARWLTDPSPALGNGTANKQAKRPWADQDNDCERGVARMRMGLWGVVSQLGWGWGWAGCDKKPLGALSLDIHLHACTHANMHTLYSYITHTHAHTYIYVVMYVCMHPCIHAYLL